MISLLQMVIIINIAIFIYFMVFCTVNTILLIASFPDILNRFDEVHYGNISELINNNFSIPLTIVMPAYNLSHEVFEAIASVLNSDYPGTNIIIVNDGSTDDSLKKMIRIFNLYKTPLVIKERLKTAKLRGYYESKEYPNLVVIDKEHSNTGDTLNAGINACRTPYFASVDADTVVEEDAITRIMFGLLSTPHCVSVGGSVYVINDNKVVNGRFVHEPRLPKTFIPAVQVCEYLRSFLFCRAGWNTFGGALSYAGAFTLFEREAVIDVGGYDTGNYAQDAEILLKLHGYMREKKYPYNICFTPAAFSWTEVPWTWKSFWIQRDKWERGLLRSFCLHRYMLFNPKYGIIGLFSYPVYVAFELLSPIVECTAYIMVGLGWCLGVLSLEIVLLFVALALGYSAFLTLATIFLNLVTFNKYPRISDGVKIFSLVFLEMMGFRQYHAVCKTWGSIKYIYNRMRGERL